MFCTSFLSAIFKTGRAYLIYSFYYLPLTSLTLLPERNIYLLRYTWHSAFWLHHINNKSNLCFGCLRFCLKYKNKLFCLSLPIGFYTHLSIEWVKFCFRWLPQRKYNYFITLAVSIWFTNRLLFSCMGFLLLSLTGYAAGFVLIFKDSSEGFLEIYFNFNVICMKCYLILFF